MTMAASLEKHMSKAQIKNILLNPTAEYKQQNSQTTDDVIVILNQLKQQYTDIKQQLKESENNSKKISRQIGEAKREKRSCDDLLQAMRQHSAENKTLKNQLEVFSKQILAHFITDNSANDSADACKGNDDTNNVKLADSSPPTLPVTRIHDAPPLNDEQLSIHLLTQEDHKKWNHYAQSNPASSLYHRIEWKQLIENVFGHDCFYFYASVDKKVVGILPLVRLNSRLFGNFMVSMPYFNSGGAIANSLQIEQQLMQSASEHAKTIGVEHIEYRDDISRTKLPVRDEKVNMILSLPDSEEALWQSFSSKLRSQIRRPQRENTSVSIGGLDFLNDFYTVFAKNMRDLGTPVYSISFFSHILSTFPDSSKIIIIRLDNQPVAAAFLLAHNKTLEIPWASTVKKVNHLSMNMLLYWEVLKFSIERNYHFFDFGRSSKNAGTYRFKQQWGAKPKQCYWHYWLKDNAEMPSLNPNNPKFKLVIAIWKKIPVWLTKIIGPGIVKNLP